MRLIRFAILLLALSPLVGATCVTEFRQKGPAGPWVGEVVNTGSTPMRETTVYAEIFDATGRSFGNWQVYTCPSALMPGQTGAFEFFWPMDIIEATPPLRAQVNPASISYEWSGDQPNSEGLVVREIERNPDERYVLAEISNDSAWTFSDLRVCATLRDAAGTLLEVANHDIGYSITLKPGESRQFPLFFNTLPTGVVEFFPMGNSMCCPSSYLKIDGSNFTATASRIIERGGQRVLEVAGEIENPYEIDLDGLVVSAHLQRSISERVDQWFTGCNGKLPASGKASVWLWIPLKSSGTPNHTSVVLSEARAFPAYAPYKPPVSDVRMGPLTGDVRRITATVHNPTTSWIAVTGGCFNLRDASGRLVGTNTDGVYVDIAPGGSVTVTANAVQIDDAASADAIVFAEPRQGPPPTISPPDY